MIRPRKAERVEEQEVPERIPEKTTETEGAKVCWVGEPGLEPGDLTLGPALPTTLGLCTGA